MRSFELETRSGDGAAVVEVAGSVDAVTAPRLAEALQATVAGGEPRVVVDLAGVSYVSSAGLRAILSGVKAARTAGGDLAVAAAQPQVREVFELAGLTTIVVFHDDAAAAIAGLR
ncbi:MAG: STAS domain-containing protein [Burkholderiaceae bacterium]|nr:STAS domain-containing protein [Burkholderiaceae bacterium]